MAWQRSIGLVKDVYQLTGKFPKSEMFGLTSQMRRAAVSIPANIAEGYSRKHRAEYVQFLRIAFLIDLSLPLKPSVNLHLPLLAIP